MVKIVTVCLLAWMAAGCGAKQYTLFQDEKSARESAAHESTLVDAIFPAKASKARQLPDVVVSEVPVSFHYVSKILPGDKLRIDIYNRSKKLSLAQAVDPAAAAKNLALTQISAPEYLVDMDGTLYLPLLGVLSLKGMTEKEAGAYLTRRYRDYLNDPYVKVAITNTRIYVLGEINKPGVIPIPPSGISLFEVLAKSGDFTDHAKRYAVNIISGPLGKQTIRTIDMTSLAAINASNLMIRPNSIVYVPPRYMKSVKVTIDDYMPILSLISSSLSSYLSIDYIMNGRR